MKQRLSSDMRDSLYLVFVAGGFFALILFGGRFLPDDAHPLWKNIYFWSSSATPLESVSFALFAMIAAAVNNAPGRPRRSWLASLAFVAGLGGIFTAARFAAGIVPRIGLFDGVESAIAGLILMMFLADGVLVQVWRNLLAENLDYAGRFLPLAGTLICLVMLGISGWSIVRSWGHHDYTPVADVACFTLGMICVLIGGKRRQRSGTAAATA